MGKIVKYCAVCDESFAEKFGYCPTCGQEMTAFEMNPVKNEIETSANKPETADANIEASKADDILEIPTIAAPVAAMISPTIETPPVIEAKVADVAEPEVVETEIFTDDDQAQLTNIHEVNDATEDIPFEETAPATKTFAAGAGATVSNFNNPYQTTAYNYPTGDAAPEGDYRITVIEEKGVQQRNIILLGTLILMTSLAVGGVVYNLFTHNLYVNSIDQDSPLYVAEVDPIAIEEEKQPKKEKDNGGGGGGGGKNNPQEVSKGRLPNQVDKPIMPPQPLPQVTNASLPNPNETQGKIKRERTSEPVGLPSGLQSDTLSSGSGSGGGIGRGNGTGIGGGNGTGEGNGNGSGSGNGNGNGNGNGTGNGNGKTPPPPPTAPVGVTEAVKILAKPRANYTDAARQNQVQGTVTLRVTFLPSGQIGGIAPVSGLPYGLTEQAIAAARGIRFEPAKKNGVPYAVTKQVQYSFTIY
ncbi:MAG: energy transducer TonB [Pyrinomonadaceae bacterium]